MQVVEEYYEHGSLANLFQSGIRLDSDEELQIAHCCVLGLSDLHVRGIMHYVSIVCVNRWCRMSNHRICSSQMMEGLY